MSYKAKLNKFTGELQEIFDADGSDSPVVKNANNIDLLAFRIATNGDLSKFNMIDGIVDEYVDQTGISTGKSSGYSYNTIYNYFTPVSSGIDAYVKLLLHLNGVDGATSSVDSSDSSHTLLFDGTAELDTAQKKFGTTSCYFGGAGNIGRIRIPDSTDWDFGSGDFTIDLQARTGSLSNDSYNALILQWDASSSDRAWYFQLHKTSSGQCQLIFGYSTNGSTSTLITTNITWSIDTWHHVAVERYNNKIYIYLDGILQNTGGADVTGVTIKNSSDYVEIGNNAHSGTEAFGGWLDEIRVSKGIARYKGVNFTAPMAEYQEALSNMILVSQTFSAELAPTEARIVILEEDIDTIILNTDLKVYVSEDDGDNYHIVNLSADGNFDTSKRILTGSVTLSEESDTDMLYKVETSNEKNLKLHGIALSWN